MGELWASNGQIEVNRSFEVDRDLRAMVGAMDAMDGI
jgi:hypothetical protein